MFIKSDHGIISVRSKFVFDGVFSRKRIAGYDGTGLSCLVRLSIFYNFFLCNVNVFIVFMGRAAQSLVFVLYVAFAYRQLQLSMK